MYISHRFEDNVCATMHLRALQELFSKQELVVVDLRRKSNNDKQNNWKNLGPFSTIEKIISILQLTTWFLTRKRISTICQMIKEYNIDVVFVDESIFGKLVFAIKKTTPHVKVITFYHDIVQDLYKQWLKNHGWSFLSEYIAGVWGEKLNQRYSDVNLVLNERDAKLFEKHFYKKPEGLLPMAVEKPDFNQKVASEYIFNKVAIEERYILFVGSMYQPNLEGLDWFVHNVFSELSSEYRLIVIGRGLEKLKNKYLQYEQVHIVGGVSELAPYYNNTDIVIAPIFSGGGMKQKTAEAFAYGKTFIGTTESLQGYEAELNLQTQGHNMIFLCDTAEEQIKAFEYVEKYKLYGFHEELNDMYEKKYSKSAIIQQLQKWIYK